MDIRAETDKLCIIGAGPSGLAAAKTFKQRGIPFDCLEREGDIGGLWNAHTETGVVYDSTFLVSSRRHTGFEDFPFPDDYPIYPSHAQVLTYLKAYAKAFGIDERIEFNAEVVEAKRTDGGWRVHVKGESHPRFYKGLVMANGHHHIPRIPKIPGTFSGEIMHSRDYRNVQQLAGKRVVVAGGGNSACDIVVDATSVAKSVHQSLRRGYHFVPKFILGRPTDGIVHFFENFPMPYWLRNRLYTRWMRLMAGRPEKFGLPKPDYWILDSHPTMNTILPQLVAHGRIDIKPDIAEFDGNLVRFADGSEVEADLVVFATGYEISLPFLDNDLVFDADGKPILYLNVFHPEYDDFFAVGLIQANGSIWRLADDQSTLIASYLIARSKHDPKAEWFAEKKRRGIAHRSYVQSERHTLETNYFAYRRLAKKLIRRFGALAKQSLSGAPLKSDVVESEPFIAAIEAAETPCVNGAKAEIAKTPSAAKKKSAAGASSSVSAK
ncbi:NAD(P)-binding domain-containing protein [Methyloligella sp. 2.7D]|uniref:flavin-containing monooxygenase n=1 Tax=unclassified Methyloligella TaxID=2625955 RepID=UPI00157C8906|nr:NAD(P)-binding domain-containing protein [Methyloligella sp. GL2]QKP77324.1 NAD(P)-binding domain-containing protein [Methyloligella sp. GL2]